MHAVASVHQACGAARTRTTFLWEAARERDRVDADEARQIVDALIEAARRDSRSLAKATARGQAGQGGVPAHMLHVAVLTILQASGLGVSGPLLQAFGMAGLLHDIGKARTPLSILNKPTRMTPQELAVVKRHAVDGAQMLRRSSGMPPLAAVVAFEHHLGEEPVGYPEQIEPRRLNVCTSVVRIADAFDTLGAQRPCDSSVKSVVRVMKDAPHGSEFDTTLLERFASIAAALAEGPVSSDAFEPDRARYFEDR